MPSQKHLDNWTFIKDAYGTHEPGAGDLDAAQTAFDTLDAEAKSAIGPHFNQLGGK